MRQIFPSGPVNAWHYLSRVTCCPGNYSSHATCCHFFVKKPLDCFFWYPRATAKIRVHYQWTFFFCFFAALVLAMSREDAPLEGESHGLSTLQSHRMYSHCLRLLPGDDIVLSLCAFAEKHSLAAAVVITCVGSTEQTTLRPAGVATPRVFNGKYEIVSLTGTLGSAGHHLHMSISDPDCNVFGGHMLPGCIVRTTAEIVLGVLEGVRFDRPMDPRTGYDELSITCQGWENSRSDPECALHNKHVSELGRSKCTSDTRSNQMCRAEPNQDQHE